MGFSLEATTNCFNSSKSSSCFNKAFLLEGRNTRHPQWGQSNARSLEDALTAVPISLGPQPRNPHFLDEKNWNQIFQPPDGMEPLRLQHPSEWFGLLRC